MTDGHCFYDAISFRLVRNNSLINLLNLKILTSLKLFLSHEFYSRLPSLNDAYNYGKAVLRERFFEFYELVLELARWLRDTRIA